ncbi:MAG TPA: S24 family peptidase [Rhodocyclaceae bacterium]|nr:S24 family peptidase [Rhodocyclaceae bacterium]
MDSVPDQKSGEQAPVLRRKLGDIPVRTAAAAPAASGCEEGGVFALQVLGDDMLPEFEPGDVIVAEVDGHIADGVYVVARSGEEWLLRRLVRRGAGWWLVALAAGRPEEAVADLSVIRGVVIQKSKPGRRRSMKRYV